MVPEQLVSLCQKRKKGRNGRKREEEEEKNLEPYLMPCTTINSKWIIDLYVRATTIKLTEENRGGNFVTLVQGKDFLRN